MIRGNGRPRAGYVHRMQILATAAAFALSAAASTDLSPRTVEAEGRGLATAPLTGLSKPALTGFRLRYLDGEHEVRAIGMKQEAGQVRGVLADQNGDDDMSMRATYEGWDFYRGHRTSGVCRGTCSLPVAARPTLAGTERLVLVNFEIRVTSESDKDRRIRVLSVRPSDDESSYRVEFRDNDVFEYSVTLDYAWIASGHSGKLTDMATRSATERMQRIPIGHPNTTRTTFISGFSVEFKNGEHNFGDLAFETDAARQCWVRFNDANYDDPMIATLDRVWIR